MRIVIDLQAAQSTGSRYRGIGRYSLSLAQAMVRNRGKHEILIALNGLFPETIEPIRAAFANLMPQENIRVWHAVASVADIDWHNDGRRQASEIIREAFLASLKPDIVHVTSMYEGLGDDALTSVGAFASFLTAVTLYDLIPFIHRHPYLDNPSVDAWYFKKLEHFRRADLWLAISESSRQEGLNYLNLPPDQVVNISTAADSHFQIMDLSSEVEQIIRQRYGLVRPFVMYTGGIDHRKNIEGLIRAFSLLPEEFRGDYQLAIVCSARPEDQQRLLSLAKDQGLAADEVILTDFVPEEDLVALYNLCKLFVFPSWHEGFGLPALEAMHCGAPVIAANTSSLPEVIGWDEALFDPRSDSAIAALMARALGDEAFRKELQRHGRMQAAKFSWDASAKTAIAAIDNFHTKKRERKQVFQLPIRRLKLAYVSPLPPARSGIADYSAELLPELSRHYEIEVIVDHSEEVSSIAKANWPVRTAEWFASHANEYDRVLYHFGNSAFHSHMFGLLAAVPGVVVLHDFFLSSVVLDMDFHGITPGGWVKELYHSHGYPAVQALFHMNDSANVMWKYPCNLSVLQNSLGVIVHSDNSRRLASHWYGKNGIDDWEVISLMRQSAIKPDRSKARAKLGFTDDDFVVCSFGLMGPTKLNHRLLEAWLVSRLSENKNCHLVFVGENQESAYGQAFLGAVRDSNAKVRIRITGWVDMDTFREYLVVADIGVQLRTLSRGETSAAVLDCMNYGLATIVNVNGSMADLPDAGVWKLPDEFTDEQLVDALEALWQDQARRVDIGQMGREIILENHNPGMCADQYFAAIERYYESAEFGVHSLVKAIAEVAPAPCDSELLQLAEAIAKTLPQKIRPKQLFVDVSELVQRDSNTGIQRVVRSILREWLTNPPDGFRIEPVYATTETKGYLYARKFSLGFLGCPVDALPNDPIEFASGDFFLGLDLQSSVVPSKQEFYQEMRRQGVEVKFVVYDLLPILRPDTFISGTAEGHAAWLAAVAQSHGAICISQSVANELKDWLENHPIKRELPFSIDWFHLGADIDNYESSRGLPDNANQLLNLLRSRPTFLSVGTIEPRKGQEQIIAAFDMLWTTGSDINLVLVGKQGWKVESLIDKINKHTELNKRLFWLEGISDEYLEKVYVVSTCLIAASEGEGFGLPLIEAAQHRLPIIARDIPVFREVAGEHAYYFAGKEPEAIANAVQKWLKLYEVEQQPKSNDMPWLTWKQSAIQLMSILVPNAKE
jgi:glycosyltransferase involved in cell wall biosynthesis